MYYLFPFKQIYYNAKLTSAALNLLEQVIDGDVVLTCSSNWTMTAAIILSLFFL